MRLQQPLALPSLANLAHLLVVACPLLMSTPRSASQAHAWLQEAELLASLCHPCIITLYGVAVGQESACPVLEYVRGSSLRTGLQQLRAQGSATPWLRCAIALQAARGACILLPQCCC